MFKSGDSCAVRHAFEFKLENPELFAICDKESIANQIDHFANAFVLANVVYSYDNVTTL